MDSSPAHTYIGLYMEDMVRGSSPSLGPDN